MITRGEANVIIQRLMDMRIHFDHCRGGTACRACHLDSDQAANTINDVIDLLRDIGGERA